MGTRSKKNKTPKKTQNQTNNKEPIEKLIDHILREVDRRIRASELRNRISLFNLEHEHTVTRANIITTQTLLMHKEVLSTEEFTKAYEEYMQEHIGIVENGRMKGNCMVSIYNLTEKSDMLKTCADEEPRFNQEILL